MFNNIYCKNSYVDLKCRIGNTKTQNITVTMVDLICTW